MDTVVEEKTDLERAFELALYNRKQKRYVYKKQDKNDKFTYYQRNLPMRSPFMTEIAKVKASTGFPWHNPVNF